MKILIIGAAGMLGRKLVDQLIEHHQTDIASLVLVDIVTPSAITGLPAGVEVETLVADYSKPEVAAALAAGAPDVVFLLAAVVSGEAEQNFQKGYASNVHASWQLLECFRQAAIQPRVIFASSLAVYGKPFPDLVPETWGLLPSSSYGTQKAMIELLLSDYTRKGFINGLSVRLPTITVRPGKPNAAASSFLSSIIREPLAGEHAVVPVPGALKVWISSPAISVTNLAHAGTMDPELHAGVTTMNLPGLTISVNDMIATLEDLKGSAATGLLRYENDPLVEQIVGSWPFAFDTATATGLGFQRDASFEIMVRQYIETC